jgi:hypothetical protein
MKRIKLMSLEFKFENFSIKKEKIIENMYSRLMHIQNKFDGLRDSLSNFKIVDKIIKVMMRRSKM